MSELLTDFESIGAGCEFGMVQRCCGAEPLGLFRFTGSRVDNLVLLLESGFQDFLLIEDMAIDIRESEYMIYSRRYNDFRSHTNSFVQCQDGGVVLAREAKKMAYLKGRFLSDWNDAARIYVHCGCEDEIAIGKLHRALRRRSDCALLWVVKAVSIGDRGRVDVQAPGLLKGYVAHYADYDGAPRLDLPGWAMVCRSTEAILREGRKSPPTPARIEADFAWSRAPGGVLESWSTGGRCRVLHQTTFNVAVGRLRVTAEIPGRRHFVVSLWVRLAASFEGCNMVLAADDVLLVNAKRADMRATGVWQQIWLVGKVVQPREALQITLYAEATKGSECEFAGWQIERGGIPNESLRPTAAGEPGSTGFDASRAYRLRSWAARALMRTASRIRPPAESSASLAEGVTGDTILRTADILLRANRIDEAEGLLRTGMSLFPWRADLFTHYALCAQASGHLVEAVNRWSEAALFFPQYALAHYSHANVLQLCGEIDRAITVVDRALPRHGDDIDMLVTAARVYAAGGRWAQALAKWDRVSAVSGVRPEWRDERAKAASAVASLADDPFARLVPPG